MSKQNLSLIINAIILTFITVGFVVIYSMFMPATKHDKLFGEPVTLGEINEIHTAPSNPEEPLSDDAEFPEYDLLLSYQEVFNRKGEKLGYVYVVRSQYDYYNNKKDIGVLQLLIGITVDKKVSVQIDDMKQTSIYSSGIQAYVKEFFQNFELNKSNQIPNRELHSFYDMDASGTASMSTNKVKELVKKAIEFYLDGNELLQKDPLIDWYGEGYQLVDDPTFTPSEKVISKQIVKDAEDNTIGYLFLLTASGDYDTVFELKNGSISIYVGLDTEGVILGIDVPKDVYEHTASYYDRAISFLNQIIGTDISDFTSNVDLTTGATYSSDLIQELLEALGGEWS